MTTNLTVHNPNAVYDPKTAQHFGDLAKQYAAGALLVPQHFRGKPADCFIAIEMAQRMDLAPMMLMQNVHVINGKPGMSAQLVIALVNQSGRFTDALSFEHSGSGEDRQCRAYATRTKSQTLCETVVTYRMAVKEGWTKNPKWQTLTDQMLAYRAASFFARLHAPDVLLGMRTDDEVADTTQAGASGMIVTQKDVTQSPLGEQSVSVGSAVTGNALLEITHDASGTVPLSPAQAEARAALQPKKKKKVTRKKKRPDAPEQDVLGNHLVGMNTPEQNVDEALDSARKLGVVKTVEQEALIEDRWDALKQVVVDKAGCNATDAHRALSLWIERRGKTKDALADEGQFNATRASARLVEWSMLVEEVQVIGGE